jgi:glutamate--cysteine ligase
MSKITLADTHDLPINLRYLIQAALASKLEVTKLDDPNLEYLHKITDTKSGQSLLIKEENIYPDLSPLALKLTKHKIQADQLLRSHGIQTPQSFSFTTPAEAISLWHDQLDQQTAVIKPEDQGLGRGVFVDLRDEQSLKKAAQKVLDQHSKTGLIQKHIAGLDLRIQAVGGQLMAACLRIPAHVTGDGQKTVTQLVAEKSQEKFKYNPGNVIQINQASFDLLEKQSLTLDSVLKKGQRCQLQKAANIGLGGDPVDITDTLDSSFYNLVEKIAQLLDIQVFAVDLMLDTTDEDISPITTADAYVLEINAPSMWAHHHFAEGQKRNIAQAIIDNFLDPENLDVRNEKYLI